jgi:DNA-binding CsgD family transcriptional regulator
MLYGRSVESGRIDALLANAADGHGGALVVRGEPGAGKTALIADAVSRSDAQVLWTQGFESESPLAFAALHRLVRPVLPLVDRLPPPQADALLVALGERNGPSSDRFVVFVATLSLLVEAAEPRPVVVVVDDAHWLDAVSAEALLFVARRLQSDRVAMVFGARDGDVRRFDAPGLTELTIGGLDTVAAGALLAERTDVDVSDEVRDAIVARTGGNPLALVEIPTVLSASQLRGVTPLPSVLPLTAGVERSFLDRCRRLSSHAQALLLVAAADDSGHVAIVQAAGAALGLGDEALAEAEGSGLVRVEGAELHLRHPLVRSAVYAGATVPERQRVHGALAVALQAAGEADRRAWHLALATVGPDGEVARELDAVAARADQRGGHDAASAAWERSALLSRDAEDRSRRLLAAARSAWVGGVPGRARALADDARQRTSDPILTADVDMLRGRLEWSVGSSAVGHRIVMRAAREVAPYDPVRALEMAMVATTLATYGGGSGDTGLEATILPRPLPERSSPRLLCLAALLAGQQHVLANEMAGAAVELRRAFELVERTDDDANLLSNTALAAFHLGEVDATARDLSRLLVLAREQGDVSRIVFALSRLPMADIPTGRWEAAAASTDEALLLAHATGQPALTALPLAWRALLAALRGTAGGPEALAELAGLVARQPVGIGVVAVTDIAEWARGVSAAGSGDVSAALHHLSRLQLPAMRRIAAVDRLEAAADAGDAGSVAGWADDLDGFAGDVGAGWAAAAAAHGRALILDGPAAEAQFGRALELHGRHPRPFDQARTRLAYGELLRRTGRRVDARVHLRTSLESFDELGATRWSDRARQELRASGESARPRDPSTVLDLTPQEQHVVRLVKQGLSNRDVAGRLFLSPRTVEYHLSHVYQKLGVSSRGELAGLGLA